MIDKVHKLKGHLIIESFDIDGNLVDKFDEHNMIMDNARLTMAMIASGVSAGEPLNKFVLGTEGHNGDILTPRDGNSGFVKERTELFAEELGSYVYPITFTPPAGASGACVINTEPDSGSSVTRTQAGTDVTYVIDIPLNAANNTGVATFTEAALYAGSLIFSMKTFRGKIKDDTNALRVTWTISY